MNEANPGGGPVESPEPAFEASEPLTPGETKMPFGEVSPAIVEEPRQWAPGETVWVSDGAVRPATSEVVQIPEVEAERPSDEARPSAVEMPDQPSEMAASASGRPMTSAELRDCYPGEYTEVSTAAHEVEPFADPREDLDKVNPHYQSPTDEVARRYETNCADCARSVEEKWRGLQVAAAGREPAPGQSEAAGEPRGRIAQWAGTPMTEMSQSELTQRLQDAGPGASAVVEVDYAGPDGQRAAHAMNLVNYRDTVLLVDGQTRTVSEVNGDSDWFPPAEAHSFWAERTQAIIWGADGKELK